MLTVVALLLLFNLGVMFSPPVHAIGKTQYKAVALGPSKNAQELGLIVQQGLDQQSAQGWEYVGNIGSTLIFKK